ncbi:MAG: type II toxin-antitoxin system RelE/ParE family toxin [Alphaproteobacteria bacterium]
MPRQVEYSVAAISDISDMRRWLHQPGAGRVAKERAQRIAAAIRELRNDPVMWPKGEILGTRERVIEGYTVIYHVDPDTNDRRSAGDVFILRVFGPGQDRPAHPSSSVSS